MFISEGGWIKLGDLGLAKQIINSTTSNSCYYGTPKYEAPEVFKKEEDLKRDVWSLGVSLFELAEGWNPYEGNGYCNVDDYCKWVICR